MKKSFFLLGAVLAIVAGCAKVEVETPVITPDVPQYGFVGIIGQTKTTIEENGAYHLVQWELGDVITVDNGAGSIKTFSAQNSGYSTTFLCADSDILPFFENATSFTAKYNAANYEGGAIVAEAGSAKHLPMTGTGTKEDRVLTFTNDDAVLKVSVAEPATSVTVSEAGYSVTVKSASSSVFYVPVTAGSHQFTVEAKNGETTILDPMVMSGAKTMAASVVYPITYGMIVYVTEDNQDVKLPKYANTVYVSYKGAYTASINYADGAVEGEKPATVKINSNGYSITALTLNLLASHVEIENGDADNVDANTSSNTFVIKPTFKINQKLKAVAGSVVAEGLPSGEKNVQAIEIPQGSTDIIISIAPVSQGEPVRITNESAKADVTVIGTQDKEFDYAPGSAEVTVVDPVAAIGGVQYPSLASAIENAQAGDVITLLKDCNGDGISVAKGKSFTVDFGGYTFTMDGEPTGSAGTKTLAFQLLQNSKITFKNGTITSPNAKVLIQNYADLTLDGITLDGSQLADDSKNAYTLSTNNGTTVIRKSTIIARAIKGVAFDVCCWSPYEFNTVNIESGSIKGAIELSTYNGKKAALNFYGGDYSQASIVMGVAAENVTVKKAASVSIDAPEGYSWIDNTLVKGSADAKAVIGSNSYATLAAAVTAAASGDIITLLADCAGDGIVIKGKDITIDFNGKVYTVDANTVGSAGTETQAFQLLAGNEVTFKNGTITSSVAKMLIQNYATLNLESMVLDGSKLIGDKPYTLSTNYGVTTIKNSSIIAHENGVAFDACTWNPYEANTVNFDSGVVSGPIEVISYDGKPVELYLNSGDFKKSQIIIVNGSKSNFSVKKTSSVEIAIPEGYKWVNNALVLADAIAICNDKGYSSINTLFSEINSIPGDDVTVYIAKDFAEDLTDNYKFTKNVAIKSATGANVSIDLGFQYGKSLWSIVADGNGKTLTLDKSVSIIGLGQLFAGYGNGGVVNVNNDITAQQIWSYKGGVVNINPSAKVVAAYGDGMVKMRRNGAINVAGALEAGAAKTLDLASAPQFAAGYFSLDYGDNATAARTLSLKNTYTTAEWYVDETASQCVTVLDNSVLKLSSKYTQGSNAESSLTLKNGSRVIAGETVTVQKLAIEAGSVLTAKAIVNKGTISIDATGISQAVKVIDYTGSSAMTLADYGTVNVEGAVAKVIDNDLYVSPVVAKIGDATYETLADAIAAAQAGNEVTIQMIGNSEVNDFASDLYTIASGKNIVLDLNGKTVSATASSNTAHNMFYVKNGATFTVKDSAEDGNITYTYTANHSGYTQEAVVYSNGDFNLVSGTIKNMTTDGNSAHFVVDQHPNQWGEIYSDLTPTFHMTGGKLYTNGEEAVRLSNYGQENENIVASVVIDGGEIEGWDAIFIQEPGAAYKKFNLTVNNGTLKGSKAAIRVYAEDPGSVSGKPIAIELNAGTFTSGKQSVSGGKWLLDDVLYVQNEKAVPYVDFTGELAPNVAKIGEKGYKTLADAVAAAKAGSDKTITIIVTGDYTLPGDVSGLTIQAGTDIVPTFNIASAGSIAAADNATLKGLKFILPLGNYTGFHHSDATFDSCSFEGLLTTYHNSGKQIFKDCSFKSSGNNYSVNAYGNCDFTGCSFTCDEGKAIYLYTEGLACGYKVNFDGCSFENTSSKTRKPAILVKNRATGIYTDGYKVTIKNCTATGFADFESKGDDVHDYAADGLWGMETANPEDLTLTNTFITVEGQQVYPHFYKDAEDANLYHILNAKGLKTLRNEINVKKVNYAGKTVKLEADIDLNKENWAPIECKQNEFGVFEGNNKTISNFVVSVDGSNGIKHAGLFGALGCGTVQNLIIDNANVSGVNQVGAIVGYGICAEFYNCKVYNSTITSTVKSNDDGDKAGAICGYLSYEGGPGKIDGCYVENCTITAYRDLGGICGIANGKNCTVTNNTVKDVEIVVDNSCDYKPLGSDDTENHNAGLFAGQITTGSIVESNIEQGTNVIKFK